MDITLPSLQLTTRDGTLAKDSRTVNTLGGKKRPGLTAVATLPAGTGQGMLLSSTLGALAIVGNNIYSRTTGLLVVAIPSGVGPYEASAPLPVTGLIVLKDATHIWTLVGNVITLIATGFSLPMLPGLVYLDRTYYVLLSDGSIRGSGLDDPTTWDPLNKVVLNADLGNAVAIARQSNYLMGFADSFTMLYYDAGNPLPGSPLSPAQNTYADIGCASAGSIAELNATLFFIGRSLTHGRSVYTMVGQQMQPISNVDIDRILDSSTLASVSAWAVKVDGHDLYVLTLRDIAVTLVYTVKDKLWRVWTSSTTVAPDPIVANSYNQTYFTSNTYLSSNGEDLLQHDTNGKVYRMSSTVYQDDLLPIDVQFVTQQFEGGVSHYQRIGAAEVQGDKVASTAYLRYSDDDYQTWSPYQLIDLAAQRSQTVRQGAAFRRAYQLRHTDNVPLNLRVLALDMAQP